MSERRYTDDEVAEIFARASEVERTAPRRLPGSEGLTLGDLQQIGREAGLAPESIAHAARELDRTHQPAPAARFLGLPLGVARTVHLDRRLTDEEWERLVVELRETFDARGSVRVEGNFRQWTNGNLQVLVEPDGEGQRIRMRTLKGDSRAYMMAGLGMTGVGIAATVGSLLAGGSALTNALDGLGPLLVIGAGFFGLGAARLPGWARQRRQQMEEIAARLEALPEGTPERER
jgi:hypothetical protein